MNKLFLLPALLLAGCVSVQSNRTASMPSVQKVLVFVETPGNATSWARRIGEKLMAGREVLYTGHDLASLKPAETMLLENMANFRPDAILRVSYKGSETSMTLDAGTTFYTYVAEMHQPDQAVPFWKGSFRTPTPDPALLASRISTQLRKDGVLR